MIWWCWCGSMQSGIEGRAKRRTEHVGTLVLYGPNKAVCGFVLQRHSTSHTSPWFSPHRMISHASWWPQCCARSLIESWPAGHAFIMPERRPNLRRAVPGLHPTVWESQDAQKFSKCCKHLKPKLQKMFNCCPVFLCKPLLANKTDHLNKVNVGDIRELVDKQGLQQALNPSAVKLTAGEFLVGRSGRTEARQIAGQVRLTRSTVTSGVWMWDAWNIPSTVIMQNVRWRAYTHTHIYIHTLFLKKSLLLYPCSYIHFF